MVTADEPASDDFPDRLAFRRQLESQHAEFTYRVGSSPTFTFDNIYVLSLAKETARQEMLSVIARALGMQYELFTATPKDEPFIDWIADRVREVRDAKRDLLAKAWGKNKESIGGMGIDSPWFLDSIAEPTILVPDALMMGDRWRYQDRLVTWTGYLNLTVDTIQSGAVTASVAERLWDPIEPEKFRQLNEGIIAAWYSHTQMWRRMVKRKEKTALFLEDDIDIEWDFERLWANIEKRLPADWEIVHLGHCWGNTRSSKLEGNSTVSAGKHADSQPCVSFLQSQCTSTLSCA